MPVAVISVVTMVTVISVTSVAMVPVASVMAVTIASPMVAVAFIMAVADDSLVVAAPVAGIPCSPLLVMLPWVALINYSFIGMVPIPVGVSWRQVAAMNPNIIFAVNIHMSWYVIIGINIGHIIILCSGITYRAPFGLNTYVNTCADTYLRIGGFK